MKNQFKDQFKDYKVGDKVWDFIKGEWIYIHAITENSMYPLMVRYKSGSRVSMDYGGKTDVKNYYPRYFRNSFEIPAEAYKKPLPEIAIDTPIWVRSNHGSLDWRPRYFAGWDWEGKVEAWLDGMASHTTVRKSSWDQYTLEKPNPCQN